jgi:hypothetical protein
LPDLGDFADLAGLDDETPTLDDADSDLAELDIDLEPEAEPELEVEDVKQDQEIESDLGEEEELELADLDLEVDDLTDVAEETASESGKSPGIWKPKISLWRKRPVQARSWSEPMNSTYQT